MRQVDLGGDGSPRRVASSSGSGTASGRACRGGAADRPGVRGPDGRSVLVGANPESVRLTETYCYEQKIGRNQRITARQAPTGRIEVVVPGFSAARPARTCCGSCGRRLRRGPRLSSATSRCSPPTAPTWPAWPTWAVLPGRSPAGAGHARQPRIPGMAPGRPACAALTAQPSDPVEYQATVRALRATAERALAAH